MSEWLIFYKLEKIVEFKLKREKVKSTSEFPIWNAFILQKILIKTLLITELLKKFI